MKCLKCGADNREAANFCKMCGVKLRETCASCWIKKGPHNCGKNKCPENECSTETGNVSVEHKGLDQVINLLADGSKTSANVTIPNIGT